MPLQGEGAVQGLLAATPNVIEGDLLGEEGQGQGGEASLPCPRGMEAEAGKGASLREGWDLSIRVGRGRRAEQGPFS